MSPREFESSVMPLLPKLRQRARIFFARAADAEDLVQETLLRAWEAWGRYRVNDVWCWLWLIMRNTFLTHRRDSNYERSVTQAHLNEIASVRGTAPRAPDASIAESHEEILVSAVRKLTPTQRDVIDLQLMGLDDHSIAAQLRTSLNCVRTASCRARAKIRAAVL